METKTTVEDLKWMSMEQTDGKRHADKKKIKKISSNSDENYWQGKWLTFKQNKPKNYIYIKKFI